MQPKLTLPLRSSPAWKGLRCSERVMSASHQLTDSLTDEGHSLRVFPSSSRLVPSCLGTVRRPLSKACTDGLEWGGTLSQGHLVFSYTYSFPFDIHSLLDCHRRSFYLHLSSPVSYLSRIVGHLLSSSCIREVLKLRMTLSYEIITF